MSRVTLYSNNNCSGIVLNANYVITCLEIFLRILKALLTKVV